MPQPSLAEDGHL